MVLSILVIAFLVLMTGIVIGKQKGFSDGFDWTAGGWLTLIGSVASGFMIVLVLIMASSYPDIIAIDKKIAMYQVENTKIESQIAATISEYMEYEQKTFEAIKPDVDEDLIALVSMYPELKSDELVKAQIETYTSNNTQIKLLKEQRIDKEKDLWLLCFAEFDSNSE